jgi:CRISPR-associated endonuclease/helicase Cas3
VTADVVEGRPGWDDVVSRILDEADRHNGQCLAVFNTVRDAREVTGLLAPRVGLVHMSTRLCPRHRAKQLELVHRLLAADQPCIVVATQVIEAGIDVDFPVGLRAFGPMPAIAQVAGRVNRAGRTPGARLVLVDPADGHVPPDEYRVATDITRDLLRQGRDPLDPASLDEFYDRFLHVASDKFDFWGIQRERELLNFARVAELYRVIVDETVPVVVPFEDFDPFDVKIPDDPRRRRDLYRQIQPYCVSLRRREFDRALAVGMAVPIEMGLHAWVGGYDPQLMGLQSERSEEALVW